MPEAIKREQHTACHIRDAGILRLKDLKYGTDESREPGHVDFRAWKTKIIVFCTNGASIEKIKHVCN